MEESTVHMQFGATDNIADGFDVGLPFDIEGRRTGPMKPVERLERATWLGKVKKSPFPQM